MRSKLFFVGFLLAVLLALPTFATAEMVSAYFEGDVSDLLTVDTYPGVAGEGWVAGWAKRTTGLTSNTVALGTTSPLATGTGNYLSAAMDASAADGYLTVGRRYDRSLTGPAPDKIDTTQDYTISALFRVDEDLSLTWGDASNDRYQLYQGTSTSQLAAGGGSASTWQVGAFGAIMAAANGNPAVPKGNWFFDDYTWVGTTATNRKWDTGINMTQGTTYAIEVTVHPDFTWDATISDGASSYTKNGMSFRVKTQTGGYVEFFGKASTSADNRAFSIDSVEVHQIPEPGGMVLLAVGLVACLGLRCKRE